MLEILMGIYLRPATIEDAEDILRWRNDPSTRENSFTKGEISLASHINWLTKKLANPDCHIFIMMDGKAKVGNIRVDVTEGVGEISYMIAPECRGKGYGKKIIGMVEDALRSSGGSSVVKTLTAFTLKDNEASAKCFLANGYSYEDAEDSYCFSKSLS
jgi:spore coat polysaccharide biosynthesis protein SpsF